MEGINVLWIALAAFGGGILSGLIGYFTSTEPFCLKKFMATLVTALVSGIGWALINAVSGEPVTWVGILTAVFAGAGGDALVNRIAKAQAFK